MPPVFGPASLSPTRLKSWAGVSGITVVPSLTPKRLTSGPSKNSSMTTAPPSRPSIHAIACATASAKSSVTTTPLPAANPSSLTTYGAPNDSSAARACAIVWQYLLSPVGTPAACIISFAKALLPSSCAADLLGPKTKNPALVNSSTTPATKGASGPITTKSGLHFLAKATTEFVSVTSTGDIWEIFAIPGFPGAQITCTSGSRSRVWVMACSLAP